ncbi:MAG: hypothetical protein ABR527_04545 [Gemmatimonadota bacterium]
MIRSPTRFARAVQRRRLHVAAIAVALALGAVQAVPVFGQDDLGPVLDARRQGVPRGPRAFHETWLLPAQGESSPTPQQTVFAGRVSVWQKGPRERLEIFPVKNGQLADPIVIVSDGTAYNLVTAVGATPLARTAPARDRLVRLVLAGPPGNAEKYRTVEGTGGGVAAVVLRQDMPREFEEDKAFALRLPSGGSGALAAGISQFSPAGDPQVTAAAGARGVERVPTAQGEVSVTPDPSAVAWMEAQGAPAAEIEAFKREAGLPPYDLLPPEAAGTEADSPDGGAR